MFWPFMFGGWRKSPSIFAVATSTRVKRPTLSCVLGDRDELSGRTWDVASLLTLPAQTCGIRTHVPGASGQFVAVSKDGKKAWVGFTRVDVATAKIDGDFRQRRT